MELYENSTLIDLLFLFTENRTLDRESFIPVLRSKDNRFLSGSIKVQNALDYLASEGKIIENKLKTGTSLNESKYQNFYKNLGMYTNFVSLRTLIQYLLTTFRI